MNQVKGLGKVLGLFRLVINVEESILRCVSNVDVRRKRIFVGV